MGLRRTQMDENLWDDFVNRPLGDLQNRPTLS